MKFSNFLNISSMNLRTGFFGAESIKNVAAKLWNKKSVNIKSSELLNVFKSQTKYWTPNHRPCRICKIYIGQVGFIN